ncbi:rhodanese-like domain-containing protein [Aureibaculum luteum]|uniref:rhodanese-like domain-containing protein n=1 Tax=Aureibaculum luteum TaxID=1548456 RepID=UPI000E4DD412|nr:rhodanese-like domain-containing protein [Aureibaculum luteum]
MINRNLVKALRYRYVLLAVGLILLAGGLVLLPKQEKHKGITSAELLSNAISPERYMSTDEIAHKIVNQDPSILLIDVRDSLNYQKYSLPNALNIPLPKLLDDNSMTFLNQDQYEVVFFSNDNFDADKAWIISNRLGFKNIHVLKGGLNSWFKTIINPTMPEENMPANAFEQYRFRKAASMYFGVVYPESVIQQSTEQKKVPKKVITVKKKKKSTPEGGC